MLEYFLAIFIAGVLLTIGFFALRFLFRVLLDLYDLFMLMWTIKKNDAEYKKYLDEKARNLDKEKALRLQKHKEKQKATQEDMEEDVELYSITAEAPSPDQFWQSKIFKERFPLMKAIKEILKNHAADLLSGTSKTTIPIWRARIMAENQHKEAMRSQGKMGGGGGMGGGM